MVNLDKYYIRVEGMKEYPQVARILDRAGKTWNNGERYADWNPYENSERGRYISDLNTIYIDPLEGRWCVGLDDTLAIGLDRLKELTKRKQDIEIADKRFIKVRNEEDYKRIAKLLDKAGKKNGPGTTETESLPLHDVLQVLADI